MSFVEVHQKCLGCTGRGKVREATRGKFCEDCWRDALKKRLMGRNGEEAKMTSGEICKCGRSGRHGRCWAIRGLSGPVNGSSAGNGKKIVSRAANAPKIGAVTHEGMQLPEIIAGLKRRRDALNVAISALEE